MTLTAKVRPFQRCIAWSRMARASEDVGWRSQVCGPGGQRRAWLLPPSALHCKWHSTWLVGTSVNKKIPAAPWRNICFGKQLAWLVVGSAPLAPASCCGDIVGLCYSTEAKSRASATAAGDTARAAVLPRRRTLRRRRLIGSFSKGTELHRLPPRWLLVRHVSRTPYQLCAYSLKNIRL
jgi:hypothetical protein